MSDTVPGSSRRTIDLVAPGLARRNRAERRFRLYGLVSLCAALLFLAVLLVLPWIIAGMSCRKSAFSGTLMMSAFNFIRAQNVSPSDVFKGLDANGGLQWTNLQQSVQGQPMLYRFPDSNTPTRVLQCTPTDSIYMCSVMFQQDMHHHWRWKSMIMPTR